MFSPMCLCFLLQLRKVKVKVDGGTFLMQQEQSERIFVKYSNKKG